MSQENVEIVRRWFEGFNMGEVSPELCDPEIEIRNWSGSLTAGPYRGHDGLRRWWKELHDPDVAVELRPFQVEEIIDVDAERVVVVQRMTGRARYTGIELDLMWGAVVTVRGGKIASAAGYPTPEEAKQAAGLASPPSPP
jgi:ketosteroid isomerase-like protein